MYVSACFDISISMHTNKSPVTDSALEMSTTGNRCHHRHCITSVKLSFQNCCVGLIFRINEWVNRVCFHDLLINQLTVRIFHLRIS